MMRDLENYAEEYNHAQSMLLDDYDQVIVEQEIKIGGFGHMNNMIQKFSSDMEKIMMDTL
jgi:hypothetical protein